MKITISKLCAQLSVFVFLVFSTLVYSQEYRLGVGDTISIEVYGEEDLTVETKVNDSGVISYPFLGKLELLGKSVTELEQSVTDGLKGDYIVNPEVRVTVSGYRSVYVSGEVLRPGSYGFQPGLTVLQAITLAGGFSERAAEGRIFMVREGQRKQGKARVSQDELLGPGDTVIVSESFF